MEPDNEHYLQGAGWLLPMLLGLGLLMPGLFVMPCAYLVLSLCVVGIQP